MLRSLKLRSFKTTTILSALALGLAGPAVFAQASTGSPNTADSQVPYTLSGGVSFTGTAFRGATVAPNGTIYVADSANKRVIQITPGASGVVSPTAGTTAGAASVVTTTGITLAGPTAVAVDSAGNLFIADNGTRLIKVVTATHAASAINYTATKNPVALAIDPSTSALLIADSNAHLIYTLPLGSTGTAASLGALFSGTIKPVGLAVDSSSNVYYADATNNIVYVRSSVGANAIYANPTGTYVFKFSASAAVLPISMGLDSAHNLYVLDSGVGTTSSRLFQIPMANFYYLVPFANLTTTTSTSHPTGLALDALGNFILADDTNNTLNYLFYNNPLNFGNVTANTATLSVVTNFLFNTAATGLTAYQVVQGDYTGEFTQTPATLASANCLPTGTPGTAGQTCIGKFTVKYQPSTPGFRPGAVGFTTASTTNNILAVQVNATDLAATIAVYPGVQNTLVQSLFEPQGLTMSGDGTNLFVADEGGDFTHSPPTYTHGAVYRYPVTGAGTFGTPVTITGTTTPTAVALDAMGDLYAADYNGNVYVSQPTQSAAHVTSWGAMKPLTLTGVTLVHPMSITVDPSGDIFVGDMGPAGVYADSSTPGFIAEIPGGPLACGVSACTVNGLTPFKLTNATGVIFPTSLASDGLGNLFISDGGDGNTNLGGVRVIPAPVASGTLATIPFGNLNQPGSISVDAANNLYVLDTYNGRILVAHVTQTGSTFAVNGTVQPLGLDQSGSGTSGFTTQLVTPTAAVVWPGAQDVTIADIGGGGQPVRILTLGAAGGSTVSVTSNTSATVNVVNTGNTTATFANPTYSGPNYCTGFVLFGACIGGTAPVYSISGGCGDANNQTINVGLANTCKETVSYPGANGLQAGTGAGSYTLNGKTTATTAGNVITINGSPTGAAASLTAPALTFAATNTATLKNTGTTTLTLTSKTVSNATITGGTCATTLTSGSSCTIIYHVTAPFSTATVSVVDGAGTQTASTFYLFSYFF